MSNIVHYEAFLSYRHTERDSLVASHIQKALERYHIPKRIQQELQIKQIRQIFRDQEELEITSDLRHTIAHALENSDFLIVVCSPDTAESEWVMWEIKTFLKTHPMDHVMTVVARGDPVEVIPDILKKETVTVTGCHGAPVQVERPVEPLACNYTGSLKRADQTELPRLVATILGCSYASLLQRQRQYLLQRKVAITSVIAFLLILNSGYMSFSRNQIHESYLNALESQAKTKAAESSEMLSSYDYISAAQLALEALPSEENPEIPITSQAQSALTDAVSAYRMNELAQAWTYTAKDEVTDYQFSQSGAYLMAMDASNILTVWDCDTHEEVYSTKIMVDSVLTGFLPLDDNLVILWNGSYVTCVDYLEHAEIWERPLESSDVSCVLSPDHSSLFVASSESLALLDSHNGDLLYSASLEEKNLQAMSYSPAIFLENTTVLFACNASPKSKEDASQEEIPVELEPLRLVRWDAKEGVVNVFSQRFQNIQKLLLTYESDGVLVLSQTGEAPKDTSLDGEYFYPAPMRLTCLALPSGLVTWSRDLQGTNYNYAQCLREITYLDEEGNEARGILCAYSTLSVLLDREKGTLVSEATLSGSVLSCLHINTDSCLYLTHNGRILVHDFQGDLSYTQRTLHTQIEMARSVSGENLLLLPSMALKSGSSLLYYTYLSDESAKAEASLEDSSFYRLVQGSQFFLLQGKEKNNLYFFSTAKESPLTKVTLIDPLAEEVSQTEEKAEAGPNEEMTEGEEGIPPKEPDMPEMTLLGASADGAYAYVLRYHLSTGSLALLKVSSETGETSLEVDLSHLGADYSTGSSTLPYFHFDSGVLTFVSPPQQEPALYQYDTDTHTLSTIGLDPLGEDRSLYYLYFDKETQSPMLVPSPLLVSPSGGYAFLSVYDASQDINLGALVSLSSGSITYLDLGNEEKEAQEESVSVAGASDSLSDISFSTAFSTTEKYIAALYTQDIKIFHKNGELLGTITPSSLQGTAFRFFQDYLLLLTGNTLSRYSITGELISSVRLVKGNSTSTTTVTEAPSVLWDAFSPYLFVSSGNLMYILDAKNSQETSLGSVGGYLFYDSAQDRFYTFDTTTSWITSFSRHDLDKLKEMARHRLGG